MSGTDTGASAGGWQPDPTGRHELRYWSGTAWTDDVSDQGATSKDPLNAGPPAGAPAYQPMAAGVGARGPIGKPSSVGTVILLTIVTFGIYGLIWVYRQHSEFKAYSGNGVGGGVGVILAIFIGIVTPFILANEVQGLYEREGQQPPITTATGAWILLPLVGMLVFYLKIQPAINDFWVARGATPA